MSERIRKEIRQPVVRSDFTAAHMLDPETPLPDPETGEQFDKHGKKLGPFYDYEVVRDNSPDALNRGPQAQHG